MDLGLTGKKALITGGSRGIGRAMTLALAEHGVSVAACYQRDSEATRTLDAQLQEMGNGSHVVRADVSDEKQTACMVECVRERFGQIDILINNAGVVSHHPLAEMDLAEWRRVLDTNLTGMFLTTQAALSAMPPGSSIINVASAVALVGMAARTHYTASKAGVMGFTRSLCKEVGPRGIRANVLNPGIIETDQVAGLTPEQRARYSNLAALGRLGQPDDIAGAALFLASDLSRFVSGVTINVDGGI